MKFLIVGLGNIGDEYSDTRHNIGFSIADAFVSSFGDSSPKSFETGRYASFVSVKFRGRSLTIIKPSTYMNLSGHAVSYWMQKENIPLQNLLVCADDLALPFGTLRLRQKGSDGGHNGLKHIHEILATTEYNRLRFGIGSEFRKGSQIDYVLGKWNPEESKMLPDHLDTAVKIIKSFLWAGPAMTMTEFNKK